MNEELNREALEMKAKYDKACAEIREKEDLPDSPEAAEKGFLKFMGEANNAEAFVHLMRKLL